MTSQNLILLSDSYKYSHACQYPPGTTEVYSYLESRGGEYDELIFFGLQYYLKKYLMSPITQENITEAKNLLKSHFVNENIFNESGWQYILDVHNGYLPVKIKALPEGTIASPGVALLTIENTDPNCFWVTNFIETLLSEIWYSITVASLSYKAKKLIKSYLDVTSDTSDGLVFKLHDFGFRGSTSPESAGIGGSAHLLNFSGTDTVAALKLIKDHYGMDDAVGYSIPASEHSTITSWGEENEVKAFENMLDQFPTGFVACVSDSFDIFKACDHLWGETLREKIVNRNGTLVIRPDSGDPIAVIKKVFTILDKKFGHEINSKGFKVLPPYLRVIQGDGVNYDSINGILFTLKSAGWATDNIAFGMGGALLQKVNRDTCKFAFKCSSITKNGEEINVFKNPITDSGKKSKQGKFSNILKNGKIITIEYDPECDDLLRVVYDKNSNNSKPYLLEESFIKIRRRTETKELVNK